MKIQIAVLLALTWIAACGGEQPPQGSAADGDPPDPALTDESGEDAAASDTNAAPVPGYLALDENVSAGDILPMPFRVIWEPWLGDFDGMVERRIVRAVVPFGGYQFYYVNGLPKGATYDLLQRLESYVNNELGRRNIKVYVVVIPVSRDQLIPALLDGHADLAAGDLTITPERSALASFARPMLRDIDEVIVTGPGAPPIDTLDDLAGKEIVIRESSSYFEHMQALIADFGSRGLEPPAIHLADEILEAEDLLEMVNGGMIEMTVMDDYKAEFWATVFPNIVVRDDLVVNEGGSIAWAMRKDNPQFAGIIKGFLKKYGKGTLVGNDTYNRYLSNASRVRCSHTGKSLQKMQELIGVFQEYGEKFDFDWLMLAAQAFQESGLRQDRRSPAGAIGIMQIKPSTAADKNVGIDDITTVDGNVHAGAKYMRFIADRYFSDEKFGDLNQWIFSLAAYNAGPAKINRYRLEAAENGYDPNRWFDNVEIIAARRIGRETVTYVSNVFKYYVGYQITMQRGAVREERYANELQECLVEDAE
ncbi:MAG: lytic transglycosylase F [Gammaproteobacteria bacterium]|jgi:membrane-bound lytic murein transglycosylase MltF|nr:lytic transglycosylase F [Gammaproteobacteria bacterium]MDH3954163.1 lytic transglycosylase F [Gammaproteobacteria bacterium]